MNDPTEILDTLAARAAADPVAAVPPLRALEAELRNRRRRHRIARVGVGVVILLIGGASWSALRDADTDGVTVVAAEETPAPDADDSDAPPPSSGAEPPGDGATESAFDEVCLAPRCARLLSDLELTTLDGEPVEFRSIGGRPAVITVFATWCAPCEAQLEELVAAHRVIGDEVEFVALNSDETDSSRVRGFVEEAGVGFRVLVDDGGEFAEQVGPLMGLPTTIIVGPDGFSVGIYTGHMSSDDVLSALQERLAVGELQASPTAGPAVTTADALRNLPVLAPLGRAGEMLDITPGWPAADAFFANANAGNVAVRGRFVAVEQEIREWVAVRFVVTENLAGDPDAARPGDELVVMVLTGGQVEPALVGEQLARIDKAVLFLYRDPALFPELPDAFVIEGNVFLGVVDDEGLVHFPFAERAGWPSDPLPIDTIG